MHPFGDLYVLEIQKNVFLVIEFEKGNPKSFKGGGDELKNWNYIQESFTSAQN